MLPFKSKLLLFPYWAILKIRHFLYNKKIIKGQKFPIPVICVGNITVGGTGKTPHTEMIIRLLQEKYNVAVLSRGYKRQSKGFRIAKLTDTFKEIGDEPLQIKQKFPNTIVAVCNSRKEGITKLLQLSNTTSSTTTNSTTKASNSSISNNTSTSTTNANSINAPIDIIILDDAFQHRKVVPSHSVVLMNYNRPIYSDNLLPIGRLRDLPEQIKRAESVIISKSPLFGEIDGNTIFEEAALKEVLEEEKTWRKKLELKPEQGLYFSIITYGEPHLVFPEEGEQRYLYSKSAISFTGIANDKEFNDYIVGTHKLLESIKFADHKNFSEGDISKIYNLAKKNPTATIFTTEKDSKRLINNRYLTRDLKKRLFYIPIEVKIIPQVKSNEFTNSLL